MLTAYFLTKTAPTKLSWVSAIPTPAGLRLSLNALCFAGRLNVWGSSPGPNSFPSTKTSWRRCAETKAAASTRRSPCKRSSWRSVAPFLHRSWHVCESKWELQHHCSAEHRQLGAAGGVDAEAAEHQVQLRRLKQRLSWPSQLDTLLQSRCTQRSLEMFYPSVIVYLLPTNVYVAMSYNPVMFLKVWPDFVRCISVMYSFHRCVQARLITLSWTSPCTSLVCLHP